MTKPTLREAEGENDIRDEGYKGNHEEPPERVSC